MTAGDTLLRPNRAEGLRFRVGVGALLVALISAAVLGTNPLSSSAAEGDITWSVQPSSPTGPDGRTNFDFTVDAGSTITDWVAVTNFSDAPIEFTVYAADALNEYENRTFNLAASHDESTDLGSWTTVSEQGTEVLTLQPGTRADIPVTIAVPSDATPGDHAAGIVAAVKIPAETGNVLVEQRVGTRIYLRVTGDVQAVIGIAGLTAGFDPSLNPFGGGDASAGFELENRGNVRVNVNHRIELTGPFGIPFAVLAQDTTESLLPGQTVHVSGAVAGVPPLLLLFATASATLVPVDDSTQAAPGEETVTASTMAWAVPWLLLGLIIVIAAVIAAIVWYRRRYNQSLGLELARIAEQARADARAELTAAPATNADLELTALNSGDSVEDSDIIDAEIVDDSEETRTRA